MSNSIKITKILIHRGVYTNYYIDLDYLQVLSCRSEEVKISGDEKRRSLAKILPYTAGAFSSLLVLVTKYFFSTLSLWTNLAMIGLILLITFILGIYSFLWGARNIGNENSSRTFEIAELSSEETRKLLSKAQHSFIIFRRILIFLIILSAVLSTLFILSNNVVLLVILIATLALLVMFVSGVKQMLMMKQAIDKILK